MCVQGVDPQILISAVAAAPQVPDVAEAQARGRWSGRTLILDVDIWLDPTTPLADATHIAEAVRLSALSEIDAARTVNVRPRAH